MVEASIYDYDSYMYMEFSVVKSVAVAIEVNNQSCMKKKYAYLIEITHS